MRPRSVRVVVTVVICFLAVVGLVVAFFTIWRPMSPQQHAIYACDEWVRAGDASETVSVSVRRTHMKAAMKAAGQAARADERYNGLYQHLDQLDRLLVARGYAPFAPPGSEDQRSRCLLVSDCLAAGQGP
jgi:hypothetical protein